MHIPTLNAALNILSFLFLLAGFIAVRRRNISLHRIFMLCAFSSSSLFLGLYIFYHYTAELTPYSGKGAWRMVYFAVLIPHTLAALALLPLVFTTLYRALQLDFLRHRAIARFTLPIWLYVSLSGVVVYLMLYVFKP